MNTKVQTEKCFICNKEIIKLYNLTFLYTTVRRLHHFRALNYALPVTIYLLSCIRIVPYSRSFGSLRVSNNNMRVI